MRCPGTRRASLASLVALAVLPACGQAFVEHEVRITLSDPSKRLGTPPWKVAVMDPISLYDRTAESASNLNGGEARSGSAYVGRFQTSETGWLWRPKPRATVLQAGLVLPGLTTQGWWNARIVVLDDGSSRGYARYCPWGDLLAEGDAEILMMRGTARRRTEGWQLDLTLEVPPTRTPPTSKGS
jgi:hypothetical protein